MSCRHSKKLGCPHYYRQKTLNIGAMKIIKPSVEILEQGSGLEGIDKQIEVAGRACYASSHRIGEGTAKSFVDGLIKSGHGAMLEHGAVYLQMPYNKVSFEAFDKNPYSKVSTIEEAGSMLDAF